MAFERPDKLLGSLKGIVETLEQKSGLNSILFVIAIISLPCLILYAMTGNPLFFILALAPVGFFIFIYCLAFVIDRNFLRSEKHVREMRQLDMLGEKGKEQIETTIDMLPSENALGKSNVKIKRIGRSKDV